MPYTITGQGTVDLRGTSLPPDGLTFATSGPTTAQIAATQIGINATQMLPTATIAGDSFANTMEFFANTGSVDLSGLNFTGWSATDRVLVHVEGGSNNFLRATAKADTIDAIITGNSTIHGGAGNDLLIADFSQSNNRFFTASDGFITNNIGGTLTYSGIERFNFTMSDFDDVIVLGNGADTIRGGGGDDDLDTGAGKYDVNGGDGIDTWRADLSAATDPIAYDTEGAPVQTTAYGRVASIEVMRVTAGSGNDRLITHANGRSDVLNGGPGSDALGVGGGTDTVDGGEGHDVLYIDYSAATSSFVTNGAKDLFSDSLGTSVKFSGIESFNIRTGTGNDTLVTAGALTVIANSGAGNDDIDIETAAQFQIIGGSGTDMFRSDQSAATFDYTFDAGLTAFQVVGQGNQLTSIEALDVISGSGNDRWLTHDNNRNDFIDGGAGNDTIGVGAFGSDTVAGGTGNDDLLIVEYGAAGGSFVSNASLISNSANSRVDHTGFERMNVTVGSGNDQILLSAGDDTVDGGGGDDTLDTLTGMADVTGGAGTDVWRADLSAFSGAFTFDAAVNGVQNIGNGSRVSGIEAVVVTSGKGADTFLTYANGRSDSIAGGAGNDTIGVGGGTDTVDGGAGNDDLLIVDYSAASGSFHMSAGFITNNVGASVAFSGIERFSIATGAGNDSLAGGAANDTLGGGAGNDTLDGGTGNDAMTGGAGNDTFHVDAKNDVVVEATAGAGGGTDIVLSGASSFTLGANIENLTLTGANNSAGTGNALANLILGNAGNNALQGLDGNDTLTGGEGDDELRGGAGADSMTGGNGNDRYFVDDAGDQTIESGTGLTGGIDTTYASVTHTLGVNIENLRLQGTADIGGTGNAAANKIYGTTGANLLQGLAGADTIDGKDGADTLDGGEGNDTLTGGGGADVYRFAASNTGVDTITDFSRNFDRFDLSGGSFTALSIAPNGDAVLTHAGGAIRVQHPPSLTLAQWNALVLPSGHDAGGGPLVFGTAGHAEPFDGGTALLAHHGDWAFA